MIRVQVVYHCPLPWVPGTASNTLSVVENGVYMYQCIPQLMTIFINQTKVMINQPYEFYQP